MNSSLGDVTEFQLKSASLSMERLDGEVIAIDFASGKYFSFQGPAADLIWLLQHEVPRESWFGVIETAFKSPETPEEFAVQVEAFISELKSLGLVEQTEWLTGSTTSLPEDYERIAWVSPQIMVEDDLADLLVIDPIHDTGEDGWPEIKQG